MTITEYQLRPPVGDPANLSESLRTAQRIVHPAGTANKDITPPGHSSRYLLDVWHDQATGDTVGKITTTPPMRGSGVTNESYEIYTDDIIGSQRFQPNAQHLNRNAAPWVMLGERFDPSVEYPLGLKVDSIVVFTEDTK